jgi:hypothetical protein
MHIRRPLAALLTALALFGGGATLTACGDPATPNEGTTDGDGNGGELDDEDADRENLPDNSDPEQDTEDQDDDTQDPD